MIPSRSTSKIEPRSTKNSEAEYTRESSMRLWLAPNVHCVKVGEAFIFLDLITGRYKALVDDGSILPFSVHPPGSSTGIDGFEVKRSPDQAGNEFAKLELFGQTESWRSQLKPLAKPRRLPIPDRKQFQMAKDRLPSLVLPFFISLLEVRFSGRLSTLKRALDFILRAIMARFLRLRTLAYSARGRCLFDSKVLCSFLFRLGISPTLVIGVKTRPFGGHCWVQVGDFVINDSPDKVRAYVPIVCA
jgi:hypothetical protein